MAKSKKIKQNWTRTENFDVCFLVNFDRYFQKSIFREEARHKPVSSPNFEIFFHFLISYDPISKS